VTTTASWDLTYKEKKIPTKFPTKTTHKAVKIKKNLESWQSKLGWQTRIKLFSATTTRNVTSTEPTAVIGTSISQLGARRIGESTDPGNLDSHRQSKHDTAGAEHRTVRLAAEPVLQRKLGHANYRSRPQETEKGRRTNVCHHSRVYALQRATLRPEREHHFTATTSSSPASLTANHAAQGSNGKENVSTYNNQENGPKVTYEQSYGPHCNQTSSQPRSARQSTMEPRSLCAPCA
jgi:hypothetical protein